MIGDGAVEQSCFLPSQRIAFRFVGKRKYVGREEHRGGRLSVTGGLRKAIVEATASGTGNVRQNSVERDAALFVGIESLIEQVAEKSPVLRNSFSVHTNGRCDCIRSVLGIGREIADGCETQASNDGIGNNVHVFVDLPGLETAVEVNVTIAEFELAVHHMPEL